ncbi:MAG: aminopeptidase P family protein [Pseudomonadota bacterium]
MFQNFESKSDPSNGAPRVAKLREAMAEAGVDILLIPHADEYQNEYLPAYAERLAWITGFTGSAGAAIITSKEAVVFVDGRYTLQVAQQTDPDVFTPQDLVAHGPLKWLEANLEANQTVGIDPHLHTVIAVARVRAIVETKGGALVELSENLIDKIWEDQPAPPQTPVVVHAKEQAGVAATKKLRNLAKAVQAARSDAHVMTDTVAIAWTFNIRGGDVAHTPLTLARAVVPAKGRPKLFIDHAKLSAETEAYLAPLCDIHDDTELMHHLADLASKGRSIALDEAQASQAIASAITEHGGTIVNLSDPTRLPRACKNPAELRGARAAHLRDGAAMVSFLRWLEEQSQSPNVTEIDVAKHLEACRTETGKRLGMPLLDISFDTISGSGPHGAIVHYRVDEASNRALQTGELMLIDSGGQYIDGTTDITRTVPIGEPTNEYIRDFTLVLKGMIAISEARFPAGTRGMDIDILARNALWQAGRDYAHGTGHGVGSYLGVHEGPQNISKRGTTPLQTGMILSNEPGVYKTGSHGIRIENLIVVSKQTVPKDGILEMHSFETLTLCPIDRRLIDRKMLVPSERRWLNRYHATVKRKLTPLLKSHADKTWLERATARI